METLIPHSATFMGTGLRASTLQGHNSALTLHLQWPRPSLSGRNLFLCLLDPVGKHLVDLALLCQVSCPLAIQLRKRKPRERRDFDSPEVVRDKDCLSN